jgi:hypothetical protein
MTKYSATLYALMLFINRVYINRERKESVGMGYQIIINRVLGANSSDRGFHKHL